MTAKASAKTVAAFLMTVAVLASCSTPSTDPAPLPSVSALPIPTSASPSSTAPSAAPSPPTPLVRAAEAPTRFWRVVDRLSSNPKADLTELTSVARGAVAAQWRTTITRYRYNEWKQEGHVKVIQPSAKKSTKAGQYDVTACVDVSAVDLVDRQDKSMVKPNRPNRVQYRYTVQNDDGELYVTAERATGTC